jgi:hypothetical protein
VRALCLQTQAECDASFPIGPAYRDPEAGQGVFRFGADLKDAYLRNRGEHFARVTSASRQNDVPLVSARIEQAPAEVLRLWLKRGGRP